MESTNKKLGLNRLLVIVGIFVLAIVALIIYIISRENTEKGLLTAQFVFPVIAILSIIASILTLAIVSVVFAVHQDTPSQHALGMPAGSVRALIALSLITSFVISAIFFFTTLNDSNPIRKIGVSAVQLDGLGVDEYTIIRREGYRDGIETFTIDYLPPVNKESSEFASQLLTVFGTLVIAVSSFYFGSRATEQGSVIASAAFKDVVGTTDKVKTTNVPMAIVEEAIRKNGEEWKKTYSGIKDIKAGKKKTENVTSDINCIIFLVEKKDPSLSGSETIPSNFEYTTSNHEKYNIPSDVQISSSHHTIFSNENINTDLEKDQKKKQYELVQRAVKTHGEEWIDKYPITGVSVGRKRIGDKDLDVYCIIFQVEKKSDTDPKLPKVIEFEGVNILTDVQEFGQTEAISAKKLENGVSRFNTSEFGTLGVPVTDGSKNYFLSCYHVLFPEELQLGTKLVNSTDNIGDRKVVCPCFNDRVANRDDNIGKAIEGQLDSMLDIGIIELDSDDLVTTRFEGIKLKGSKDLTWEHENKLFVQYWGRGSNGVKVRRVTNIFTTQPINYNGKKQTIQGLVQLEGAAKKGDSGAVVLDSEGYVVGIITGSDDKATYLISAISIEMNTKYKIKSQIS